MKIFKLFFICLIFSALKMPFFSLKSSASNTDSLKLLANEMTTQGIELMNQKSFAEAEQLFFDLIEIWEQLDEYNEMKAYPFYRLGDLYHRLGDYKNSIYYYGKAEEILLQSSAPRQYVLGGLYSNIGYFYLSYGDYVKSLDYYSRSLVILEMFRESNKRAYSDARYGVAQTYYFQKRYKRAAETALKSINENLSNKIGFKKLLGNCYIYLNEYNRAIAILSEVLEEYDEQSEQYAETGLILAKAYIFDGDLDKAAFCFEEAWPILSENKSEYDPWIVYYYEIYGQYLMGRAEEEAQPNRRLELLNEAVETFDRALVLNSSSPNHHIPYLEGDGTFITPTQVKDVFINRTRALHAVSSLYDELNEPFSSLNYLEQALKSAEASMEFLYDFRISFLEEESRLELSEQYDNVYLEGFKIASALYQKTQLNKYFEKMLDFSEAGKSASLLAALNDVKARKFGGIPDTLVQGERELKMQLANLNQLLYNEKAREDADHVLMAEWERKIFDLQTLHDDMVFLFERDYPDYYALKYRKTTITPSQISGKLKRNQVVVEYFVDEPVNYADSGMVYAMVFDHEGYLFYQHPIGWQYMSDLETCYYHLTDKNIGDTNKAKYTGYLNAASRLHKILIDGMNLPESTDDLIIIPHGRLAYLPFDALIASRTLSETIDYRSLDYLVYHYNITYSYSATLQFDYFKSRQRKSRKILALAPEYHFSEFDLYQEAYRHRQANRAVLRPLPGAREEVMQLADFNNSEILMGDAATESVFKEKAAAYDLLHLAMHTIINDSIPMYSKLVFAPESDSIEDGLLNTQEIYNMKLNARLTVLSACNTGSGVMRRGEGVMSMSRAFLYAGCPSIVMTLWEVEDKVSAQLMMNFYQHLFSGRTKPEALRMAKLEHIRNADPLKAHPYFWLGYIFVGDPSPIKFSNGVIIGVILFVSVIVFFLMAVWRSLSLKKRKAATR